LPPASSNLPGSWPQARRPEGGTGSPHTTPLFGLAPHGVFRASAVAAGAVRSYRTISPLPQLPSRRMIAEAVYFLLHFPSRRRASPLASILPVGARTFLSGQTPKGSPKRPPVALRKPNSVSRRRSAGSGHSSGTGVATGLQQPTRELAPDPKARRRDRWPVSRPPIWSCSAWGFPCLRRRRRSGALLPHHFTLTVHPSLAGLPAGGIFSVALSVASPRLAVSEHAACWSSDFPLRTDPRALRSDRL